MVVTVKHAEVGVGHIVEGLATDEEIATRDNALADHAQTPHGTQPHAISGVQHTGTLDHSALGNQTPNQHHNQAHAIGGADHTGSLTPGQVGAAAAAHTHSPADTTGTAVVTADPRLSDARTPTAHAHSPVHVVLADGATAMGLAANDSVRVTPTANATYTSTVPPAGSRRTILILTSGTTSRTITFGSGFKTVGTLATGTTSARVFAISFLSDGTNLYETGRTAAMVA